jgi:hypothetical protein
MENNIDIEGAVRFVKNLLSYKESLDNQNVLITILANDFGLTIVKVQREDYYNTGKLQDSEMISYQNVKPDYTG